MPKWKNSGKLPFNQVPLLQDGDFNLVQSISIARYLSRKYNLYGNLQTGAIGDMIIDAHTDFLRVFIPAIYPKVLHNELSELKKDTIPNFLGYLEKILYNYNGFIGGESIVLADIALFLISENYIGDYKFGDEETYPKLISHMKKVACVERISQYINSNKRFPVYKLS